MREFYVDVNTSMLDEALSAAESVLHRHLKAGVSTAGSLVSREAREQAPKGETTLTHSIKSHVKGELQRMITSHLNYNGMVVAETGPQGMPPVRSILDWIKVKGIQPHNPKHSQSDLAFIMARSIAHKGTQGNDFYDRAADETQDKVTQILQRSVSNGLAAVGLGS